MNIQQIYESFYDTYSTMGHLIAELSQKTLRRAAYAADVGLSAAEKELDKVRQGKKSKDSDTTNMELNARKLLSQRKKFKDAAEKKAQDAMDKAGEAKDPERARGMQAIVNRAQKETAGTDSDRDAARLEKRAKKQATDKARLRKRFKGMRDG